jgi:hypothetical protein
MVSVAFSSLMRLHPVELLFVGCFLFFPSQEFPTFGRLFSLLACALRSVGGFLFSVGGPTGYIPRCLSAEGGAERLPRKDGF